MKHITPARALSALIAVAGIAAGSIAVSAQTPPPPGMPGMPGPMMTPGPGMPMPDHDRMHEEMEGMHARMMAMPTSDAEFVRSLSYANSFELSHAKSVINTTKNAQVHAFAQRMIDDHSTAAVKLQAATRGVGLRPAPSPRMGSMRGMPMMMDGGGANADDTYMRMQVPMHRHVLALLKWEEDNGKNAGLKTLASGLMPTVEQHLQLAQTYLSEHHLTPLTVPMPRPVPGHPMPRGSMPAGAPHNPAAPGASTAPAAEPVPAPRNPITPPSAAPLGGNGTPAPGAGPTSAPSPSAT